MSLTFIPSLWHLTRSGLLLMNKTRKKKTKAQLAIYIWIQPVAQGEDDRDSRHATCLRYFYEKKGEKSLLALRGSRDFPAQSGIFIPIIREIQQEIQIASSLLFSLSLSLFFFSLYKSCAFSLLNCLLSQLVNK